VRSPPPEEEGAAETRCDELILSPISHSPVPLSGEKVNGSEVEPRKKGGMGVRCFKIWFISYYAALI